MGSIEPYQTASGKRYRVRYRKPDHSQTDKRGFTTKKAAELFLASTEISKSRGEYIDAADGKATVGALGVVWLAAQTHLKPSSLRPVEIAWRLYVEPAWGKVSVGEVRHSDVQTWVSSMTVGSASAKPKSATSVLRAYGVLAAILDVAMKDRRLLSNPARSVGLPRKVSKAHSYLTHQQLHDLADKSGEHGTLVLTLGYTGLRWGEAIGLRVKDLDMLRRRINVTVNAVEVGNVIEVGTPKSHKRRSVAFPAFLATELATQCVGKGRDDLVFGDSNGEHMRRTRLSKQSRSWYKTALTDSGIPPMTIHDLRHSAASLAVSSGANVKAVQRMLRHASAAMTLDVYSDLFDDDLDSVATGLDTAARASVVGKLWAPVVSATP